MKRILKWLGATLAVLIATFLAIYIGTRGGYAVAHLMTNEPRVIPDAGHDVFWDNPSASSNGIRIFPNAQNWK